MAAFCKRIGRVSDTEKSRSQPTSYSKRSADMFAQIARERGYNPQLVAIIRESMLEPTSAQNRQQLGSYKGLSGSELCGVSSSVLMAAHKADLVRIFSVNKQLIHNELRNHFAPGQAHRLTHVEVTSTGYVFHGTTFNNNKAYIRADLQGNILSHPNSNPDSWVATMDRHLGRPGEFQRLVGPLVQQQQQLQQMPQQAGPAWAQPHQPPQGKMAQSAPGFPNGVEYQLHPKPADTDIINHIRNNGNGTWTIEGESSIGNRRSITINAQGQCMDESHSGPEFCKWMAQNSATILTDYAKANPDEQLPMRGGVVSHNQAQSARQAAAIAARIQPFRS